MSNSPASHQRDFTSIFIKIKEFNKREPIRRRPKKKAMAGHAQKRSPPGADEHFKEAHNAAIGR